MSGRLGADFSSVSACDSDGVRVDYTTRLDAPSGRFTLQAVTVAGLARECVGRTATVTVSASARAVAFTAPVSGSVLTLVVPASVEAASVTGIGVTVVG